MYGYIWRGGVLAVPSILTNGQFVFAKMVKYSPVKGIAMMKFNTTGQCFPGEHYMLPDPDRLIHGSRRHIHATSVSTAKPFSSIEL